MHITYSSIPVRELCECGSTSVRRLGAANATLLQQALADLQAAENLAGLPPLYGVTVMEGTSVVIDLFEAGMRILATMRTVDPASTIQAMRIEKVDL
ncbi:TPA: hypothetical protein UME25_004031 [Stenotrophomonas maltophilia]|nr:hypothetical protein [Stenotrophomonas maltophilia]